MKTEIIRRARELGFDDIRFTTAEPPRSAAHFQQWLTDSRNGEMGWLQRNAHKRIDPQLVLSGAKTIITLAVSYASAEKAPSLNSSEMTGVVARYALFQDYHDVIGEKLEELTRFFRQQSGSETPSLWYVDTGPFLERDLAQRAGLGFAGKHTNLISRKLGNGFFLAEIITHLELEPDRPETNHCGKCTRCITACPTQAITAPFQLDARLCISYLTIELKGSIPVEMRRAIGNRIYGCDDCLAACPWNRFAVEGNLMKSHQRTDLTTPDLQELLTLDDAAFKKRFEGSPILRTKRRGFLRNVCVALGNTGDVSALDVLQKASQDSEPLIAEHAVWAMDEIKKRQSAKLTC